MKTFQFIFIHLTIICVSLTGLAYGQIIKNNSEDIAETRIFASQYIDAYYKYVGRFEFDPKEVKRPEHYQFSYDSLNRLINLQYYKNGKFGYSVSQFEPVEITIEYKDNIEIRRFYNSKGKLVKGPDFAFELRIKKDTISNIAEVVYYHHDQKPIRVMGVMKRVLEMDDRGRIVKAIGINTLEDSVHSKNWAEEEWLTYDANDNLIMSKNVDISGNLSESPFQYSFIINTYNDSELLSASYSASDEFSIDTLELTERISLNEYKYNEWGQVVEQRKNNILYADSSFSTARYFSLYNKNGRISALVIANDKKQVINNQYGYATLMYGYDNKGNIVIESYSKSNHNSVGLCPAMTHYEYDSKGRLKKETHLDYYEDPCVCIKDYASLKMKYKENSQTSYFYIEENKPHDNWLSRSGCSSIRTTWDNWGNITEIMYGDAKGKPLESKDNLLPPIERFKFDERGNVIENSFWKSNDELFDPPKGVSMIRFFYDYNDYLIRESYFDATGQVDNNERGFARIVMERNQYGDTLSVKYLDAENIEVFEDGFGQFQRIE